MRVLLIDDEEELISAIAESLSFRGIDADWVTTGEEALNQLESKRYDLAVVDVRMPKISGLALRKVMKKKYPSMRFIFMTGHGSEDDYKAGSAEAAYYLMKPVHIDTLIDKMNEAVKQ